MTTAGLALLSTLAVAYVALVAVHTATVLRDAAADWLDGFARAWLTHRRR